MPDLTHTLRAFASMPHILLGGVPRERAGEALLLRSRLGVEGLPRLELRSAAFEAGGAIPARYTSEGEGLSLPLQWSGVPAGARALALAVEDPDAPTPQPFVHWLVYNLSPQIEGLPEGLVGGAPVVLNGGAVGKNSMLQAGWAPPMPPRGDVPHRYVFQLFALDGVLELAPGAGRRAFADALHTRVLAYGELVGTFRREK